MAGLVLEAAGIRAPVGSVCQVQTDGQGHPPVMAEVVGFSGDRAFLMPTSEMHGLASGARVRPSPAPLIAPKLGQVNFVLDGVEMPVRPNIGIHTQPISFVGLPVVAVPVPLEPMPIGVQIIAAPWREDVALRIAHALESAGVARAPRPTM